eukprot:PITA_10165
MPFGLINPGATFQRAMDIAFKCLVNKAVVIYLDHITVYSKKRGDHLRDLKHIFQRCLRYGISLNPKKYFFALSEGKLLGFIVSKSGIHIELDRIKEISEISLPHNKKAMRYFLGQINFVKIFVPVFSRIVSPLQTMIKKNSNFKWGLDEHEAFNLIKQAIINAPSLATLNFSESFILYTFASEKSYAAILTQANQEKAEAPITFFSSNLQGAELNYSDVEKQAYAVFKAIKYFRPFLLKTHTKVIVPFPAVRNLLIQKDVGEKRANWITTLQEYDLEIKPASIVRGQGFCKMLAGASHIPESSSEQVQTYEVSLNDIESLYADTIYYLKNGCLEKTEAEKVLQELHDGPAGGHYAEDATAHKILRAGYYWPTLFKDSHSYVRKCQICQTTAGRQRKLSMPLQSVNIEQPFSQWGLDIIGEIVPHSSKQHRYILMATNYFTKWVEAVPLKTANSENIIEFIDQFIITRFGLPSALTFDNASYFSGNAMTDFALKRGFKLKYSSNYYLQGNGLAESTNKNLIRIIKRTVDQSQKNWHKTLINALWEDRITKKASIGTSPFNLVYGKKVVLPTHLMIPSLSLVQYIDEVSTSSLQLRQMGIIKLEEQQEQARKTHAHHQALIKSSFDSSIMTRKNFQMGDLVLKWDKAHKEKGKHTKFQKMWLGPFQIIEVIGSSTFVLQDLAGIKDSLPVNGQILKIYFP